MSLAVYVLVGMHRRDPRSNEAAMKYFLLGAFSTGFLLYGIALIYGATGTIKLGPIHAALASNMASNHLLMLGLAMLLIGFGFKIAAVPFHMWTPDVYDGAPTPITAFMAVGVKLGAFAAFVRVFLINFGPVSSHWAIALWVLAALTMTAGNLIAIVQTNIKRMLAYSAIAHAGYLLVGMTAAGPQAGSAVLYYLLAYAFTNLGAFAVVVALEHRASISDEISDYRGLSRRAPGACRRDDDLPALADGRASAGRLHRQVLHFQRRAQRGLCLAGGNRGAEQRDVRILLLLCDRNDVHGRGWRPRGRSAIRKTSSGRRDRLGANRDDFSRGLSRAVHERRRQCLSIRAKYQHHPYRRTAPLIVSHAVWF